MPLRLRYLSVLAALNVLVLQPAVAQQRVVPPSPEALRMSYAPIVQRVTPAVVTVSAAKTLENRNPLMDDPFFRRFFGGGDFAGSLGKGGRNFPGPWGVSTSRNITSSKTAGLGDWTDAEIKTAITQGKRKDGTPLKGPMGFQYYAKMTDADLDAVIAYLRTVPAQD